MAQEVNYEMQVFVASSLKLESLRETIKKRINEVCETEELKEALASRGYSNLNTFVFEFDALQRADKENAQEDVNKKVDKSTFFVLLVDGVIGNATIEEYNRAYKHFCDYGWPSIFVFFRDFHGTMEDGVLKQGKDKYPKSLYKTWEEFRSSNLKKICLDNDGETQEKDIVYAYPMDSPSYSEKEMSSDERVANKIYSEIIKWLKSKKYIPLQGEKRGYEFSGADFYQYDKSRMEHCDNKPYFRRKFDNYIAQFLSSKNEQESEGKNICYVYGDSLAGKTRAVINAIKTTDDGLDWFYLMPVGIYSNDEIEKELNKIRLQLSQYEDKKRKNERRTCFIFDDIGEYDLKDEKLSKALTAFFQSVIDSHCRIIITASVPMSSLGESQLFGRFDDYIKTVHIEPLSEEDFYQMKLFCRQSDIKVAEINKTYKTAGALLINLDQIKKRYADFIKKNDEKKKYRKDLLYTIKASSIWHKTHIGDIHNLESFLTYINKGKNENVRELKTTIDELIHDELVKLPGICEIKGKGLLIQEYIYRYVIDYLGTVQNDDTITSEDIENEQYLVNDILGYCAEKNSNDNLFVMNFAKVLNRCHYDEVRNKLYEIWQNCDNEETGWHKTLAEQKSVNPYWYGYIHFAMAKHHEKTGGEDNDHILLSYINIPDECIIEALVFEVYRKLNNPNLVNNTKWYETFKDTPRIISYGIRYESKDYEGSRKLISRVDTRFFTEANFNADILKDHLDNRHFWMDANFKAMCNLLSKVKTRKNFDDYIKLLRTNYMYLGKMSETAKDKEPKSDIDLLALLPSYNIQEAVLAIQKKLTSEDRETFYMNLINQVRKATKAKITSNNVLRIVASTFAIASIKASMNMNFNSLVSAFIRPLYEEGHPLLATTYVISTLISSDTCPASKVFGLFEQYIKPYDSKKDRSLMVTRVLINAIQHKIYSSSDTKVLRNQADDLFDKYSIDKDVYYYNTLMEAAAMSQDWKEAKKVLDQMLESQCLPDIYTWGYLIDSARSFSVAAAFFDIKIPGYMNPAFPIVTEKLAFPDEIRDVISHSHYLWGSLLKRPCKQESDRNIIHGMLKYWKKTDPSFLYKDNCKMLHRGALYIQKDNLKQSFIRNLDDFKKLVDEGIINHFYAYTLTPLQQIAINLKKKRIDITEILNYTNECFRKIELKDLIGVTKAFNPFLYLFKSFTEKIELPYITKEQKVEVKEFNLLEYVEAMEQGGLKIDKKTLVALINISQDCEDVVDEIIKYFCIFARRGGYVYSLIDQWKENLKRKGYLTNSLESKIDLMSKGLENDINKSNQALAGRYSSHCKNKLKDAKSELQLLKDEYLSKVDGDVFSNTVTINSMLGRIGRAFRKKRNKNQNELRIIFNGVMGFYETYYLGETPKCKLSTDTFNSLSRCSYDKESIERVKDEMYRANKSDPTVKIASEVLGEWLIHSQDTEDLAKIASFIMEQQQCKPDLRIANNYLCAIKRLMPDKLPEIRKAILAHWNREKKPLDEYPLLKGFFDDSFQADNYTLINLVRNNVNGDFIEVFEEAIKNKIGIDLSGLIDYMKKINIWDLKFYNAIIEIFHTYKMNLSRSLMQMLLSKLLTHTYKMEMPKVDHDLVHSMIARIGTYALIDSFEIKDKPLFLKQWHFRCLNEEETNADDQWNQRTVRLWNKAKVMDISEIEKAICYNMYNVPNQYDAAMCIIEGVKKLQPNFQTTEKINETLEKYKSRSQQNRTF